MGNFRSPDAVVLKLANFRTHDPTTTSAGMDAGGRKTKEIWDSFADQPGEVRRLAAAIRSLDVEQLVDPAPDESGVREGRLLMRRHYVRERDPRLGDRCRRAFIEQHGRLFCEACGLDPARLYGAHGGAAIECHHLRPLSEGGERRTRLEDLMLVCANCHRIAHAVTPWPNADELRQLVQSTYVKGWATPR